jgi:antirestriction protein ArdC
VKKDLYTEVSSRIAAQLEAGVTPWIRPWSVTAGNNLPFNAFSKRRYNGANVVMLWGAAQCDPRFVVPAYATFNQVKASGGNVRKGERGTEVFFVKPMESKTKFKADGSPEKFIMLRSFTVFNVAQCDNLPESLVPAPVTKRNEEMRDPTIDEFLAVTGADIRHGGNSAYYARKPDYVQMPDFAVFHGASHYYGTALHELSHWTGHESRLNRTFGAKFGDKAYAAEEMVAELAAAFLAAEFGIDGALQEQNAAYLSHWAQLLRDEPRAFFQACSKAQEAANFLRGVALREAAEPVLAAA